MSHCCGGSNESQKRTQTFWVKGMTCNHCAMSVKKAVGEVHGVSEVDVSLDTGTVSVAGTGVSKEAVAKAIENAGYEVN